MAFRWVPRRELSGTDALSKWVDRMDFSLTAKAFEHVMRVYGPVEVDRFAAAHNHKLPRFNTKFDTPGSEGVDALAQDWRTASSFVLADFNLLDRVLDIIERDDATAILIVPEWEQRPFWKRVRSSAWRRRVVAEEFLDRAELVPNPENADHCFLEGRPFRHRLLVMRVEPILQLAAADMTGVASTAPAPAAARTPHRGSASMGAHH